MRETEELPDERVTVILPGWMLGSSRAVSQEEWMASWVSSKARPETLRMAESMSRTGFDQATGQQVRPKSASVIARDGSASVSSAERFLAKAPRTGEAHTHR